MTKIATVILNWNGRDMMRRFLPSVIKWAGDVEGCLHDSVIVVVDNGSTDGSVDMLREEFGEVDIIELDKNYGFAGGYNLALEKVEADYYFILNSDVELKSNPLPSLLQTIKSDENIAAVAPKILSQKEPNMFEYAGAAGGFIDKYAFPFCRGRIIGTVEVDRGQYDTQMDIFWASGAALFIKSSIYKEFGGFDADFFAHVEEIDLCWRIKNSGYRIVCDPRAEVYHVGGASLDNSSPFKLYLNYRNTLFTLHKNCADKAYESIIFRRMLIDGVLCGVYLIQGKISSIKAVLKAHGDYRRAKKELDEKRKNIKRIVTHNRALEGMYEDSILVAYALGKRTFDKIKKLNK